MAKRRKPARTAGTRAGSPTSRRAAAGNRPQRPPKAERIEAQRRARRRREVRIRIVVGAVVLLAGGGLVLYVVNNRRQSQRLIASLEAGACDFDRDGEPGRDHVANPSFEINPPSGGDHLASAAPAGVYQDADVPADGNLVHSLEHGFVILWHQPDLADGQLDQLLDIADQYQRDVLVVARPSLPVPVAATAWHKRLLCAGVEPESLARFVEEFRNDGPEDVPH